VANARLRRKKISTKQKKSIVVRGGKLIVIITNHNDHYQLYMNSGFIGAQFKAVRRIDDNTIDNCNKEFKTAVRIMNKNKYFAHS